jgi:tetratricopeptide (TPR) repeat protein
VSADDAVDTPQQAVASTAAPSAAARRAVARLVRRANSQRKKGRLSRAHDNFVEALQLISDDRGALFGLTRLALEQRDASTALACAQKLVALDTDNDDYRALLARAEKMAGVP